jgi:hypothetical protein
MDTRKEKKEGMKEFIPSPRFVVTEPVQEVYDGKTREDMGAMWELWRTGMPSSDLPAFVAARWEEIDQKRAEQLFDTMQKNRPLTRSHVEMLMQDMPERWRPFIAQGITITHMGHVIDSGHRLNAIIRKNKELIEEGKKGFKVNMLVVYGADPSDYGAIDNTRPKKASTWWRYLGQTHVNAKQSTVRTVKCIEESIRRGTNLGSELKLPLSSYEHNFLKLQFEAESEDSQKTDRPFDFEDSIRAGKRLSKEPNGVLNSAACAAHFYLSRRYGAAIVDDFYHQINLGRYQDGSGLEYGNIPDTLRRKFSSIYTKNQKKKEPKPSAAWYVHMLLHYFVRHARGENLTTIHALKNPGFLEPLPEEL